MHKLLKRQMDKYLAGVDPAPLQRFLEAVNQAYEECEADRALLERSMELTSQELVLKNSELKGDLAVSRQRMLAILDNSPSVIYLVDVDGKLLLVNRPFEHVFRVSRDFAVGRQASEFVGAKAPSTGEFEEEISHEDGLHTYLSTRFPLRDSGGAPYAWCTIATDVTGRKRLEGVLRQAQKMEAIGRLAGGVAHDFNNLLTAILGYTGLMLEHKEFPARFRPDLGEVKKAGLRAADLTRQLLAFSRKQILQPMVVDLNLVVSNIEKMLRRLIRENIVLSTRIDPNLGKIKVDPGQIEQVILNLVVNARDAMPEGGTLTIGAENSNSARSSGHRDVEPGKYVKLSVTDTGTGMSSEVLAHLFEPFFTTKAQGQGTGLGLSTVYGIVQQSGGTVFVSSRLNEGSTFEVYLPRVEESVEDTSAGDLPRGGPCSGTILLVEDEDLVRNLTRNVLESYGYKVLAASCGVEAVRISESYLQSIDLILADVVMPGMNGIETAGRIRRQRPKIKTLYVSGYTDTGIFRLCSKEAPGSFLQKPYQPDSLAVKVKEVLGGAS